MKKSFGLIGILIGIAVVAIVGSGSFYYLNTTKERVTGNNEIVGILNETEDVKQQIEEGSTEIDEDIVELSIFYKIKEGKVIYDSPYRGIREVEGANPESFEALNAEVSNDFYNNIYGKDNNFVFIGIRLITGADPDSFRIDIAENQKYHYWGKDNDSVYYYGEVVESIDVNSFEIIDGGHPRDCGYLSYVKDKDNIYYGDEIIIGADHDTFEVITNEYSRDGKNVYFKTEITDVVPINGDYCGIG